MFAVVNVAVALVGDFVVAVVVAVVAVAAVVAVVNGTYHFVLIDDA